MQSPLAQAIRTARLASGLTQDQLGTRLGLKARAVSRWELDGSAPRRRHRRELVAVISASNQAAGATLAAVIASETKRCSSHRDGRALGFFSGFGVMSTTLART